MFDLTIIIPSYNTRDLLRNCIQSIYQHTKGITFEIICLDDNSPDRSADMVAESFPEVIVVRNTINQFYAKNNNLGMRMSRARYACLLNSDTIHAHTQVVIFRVELVDGVSDKYDFGELLRHHIGTLIRRVVVKADDLERDARGVPVD